VVKTAHRRKALPVVGLPFHAVALDGKATALPCWDDQYVQRHQPEDGLPYGLMRTVTAALVTALGLPCIDAIPVRRDGEVIEREVRLYNSSLAHDALTPEAAHFAGRRGREPAPGRAKPAPFFTGV
jgi:hypothetical protein